MGNETSVTKICLKWTPITSVTPPSPAPRSRSLSALQSVPIRSNCWNWSVENTNIAPRPRNLKQRACNEEVHGTAAQQTLEHLPIDGGPRYQGTEDGRDEGVIELREQPAGLFLTVLKESSCTRVQVALNKKSLHGFS